MIKKLLKTNSFWMLVIGILLALIYVPTLTTYTVSGDDLYLIAGAPHNFAELWIKLTNFSGQYRPLTHSLFVIYRLMMPNVGLMLGFNFALMIVISLMFFINLKRLLKPHLAALLTIATMISPIFYYHFFTITAINNITILFFTLALLFLVKFNDKQLFKFTKKTTIITGAILLLLSMLSKESFLVSILLFVIILHQNFNNKKKRNIGVVITFLIVFVYFFLHFFFYESSGDYALGNSFSNIINMFLDMFSWLIGYPRGWQYGAADPKNWITYFTTITSFFSLLMIFIPFKKCLLKWKSQLLFFIAFLLSIAPFFVIDKALVFYLDVTILILVFWFSYNHQKSNFICFLPLILGFVLQFSLYHHQWHKYSFLANANEVAHNYRNTLFENNFKEYEILCVINNDRGEWGTKEGQAAKMLYGYNGQIFNTKDDIIPGQCKNSNSLILRNDGWDYRKL